jgi:hypothetical protein
MQKRQWKVRFAHLEDSLDNVHSLQNALEANKIEKKEMYVFCFQRFVETLGAKITQQGPDFVQSSYWFWVSGFMKQTAREVLSISSSSKPIWVH